MPVITKIIKKDLKLLIRSKTSALIVILGPLLVIFLVGIAFDTMSKFALNIGTYSPSYSELTDSFIDNLKEQRYRVDKIESEELCIDLIKQQKLHTCIVFPPDMQVETGKTSEIIFYVDYSKINLIYAVLESLSTKIKEASTDISLDLTEAILKGLETTKQEIEIIKAQSQNLEKNSEKIKTEAISRINQMPMADMKATADEIRTIILERVASAREQINKTKKKINDLDELNESDQDRLRTDLSSIDTYFINIYNKMEDPNNASVSDYSKLLAQVNEIDSKFAQIKTVLEQTTNSISGSVSQITTSVGKIVADLENIQVTDATTIVTPVTTNIKPIIPEKTYITYLFPSLIVLVVMFISILLATTLIMMEKHSPAFFRNFITPTRNITFLFSAYFTNLAILSVQLIIIVAISAIFFKTLILSTLPLTIIILITIATLFTFIGILIGQIFTSEETGILAAVSVGSIFLFLSNILLPIESMPVYVQNIAQFNPFILSETLLRKSILFQATFDMIKTELGIVLIYILLIVVLAIILQNLARKNLFHASAYKRYKRMEKRKKKSEQKNK